MRKHPYPVAYYHGIRTHLMLRKVRLITTASQSIMIHKKRQGFLYLSLAFCFCRVFCSSVASSVADGYAFLPYLSSLETVTPSADGYTSSTDSVGPPSPQGEGLKLFPLKRARFVQSKNYTKNRTRDGKPPSLVSS